MSIDINLVQIICLLVTMFAVPALAFASTYFISEDHGAAPAAVGVSSAVAIALVWGSYLTGVSLENLSEPTRVYSAAIKEFKVGTEGGGLILYGFSSGFTVMKGVEREGETVYELVVDEDGSGNPVSKTVKASEVKALEDASSWEEARIETFEYSKVAEGTWLGMTVTGTCGSTHETEVHVPAGAISSQENV